MDSSDYLLYFRYKLRSLERLDIYHKADAVLKAFLALHCSTAPSPPWRPLFPLPRLRMLRIDPQLDDQTATQLSAILKKRAEDGKALRKLTLIANKSK